MEHDLDSVELRRGTEPHRQRARLRSNENRLRNLLYSSAPQVSQLSLVVSSLIYYAWNIFPHVLTRARKLTDKTNVFILHILFSLNDRDEQIYLLGEIKTM